MKVSHKICLMTVQNIFFFFKAYFFSLPSSGAAAQRAVRLVGLSPAPRPAQVGERCVDFAVPRHRCRVKARGLRTGAGLPVRLGALRQRSPTANMGRDSGGDEPVAGASLWWGATLGHSRATRGLAPAPSTLLRPTSLSSPGDSGERKRLKSCGADRRARRPAEGRELPRPPPYSFRHALPGVWGAMSCGPGEAGPIPTPAG